MSRNERGWEKARGEVMIVLRRDVVSLSISLSIILAAPLGAQPTRPTALAIFPQRIAQAPPQLTFEHESTTAPPGGRPTATERSEGRAWQSLGQQIGSLQHPHAEG